MEVGLVNYPTFSHYYVACHDEQTPENRLLAKNTI